MPPACRVDVSCLFLRSCHGFFSHRPFFAKKKAEVCLGNLEHAAAYIIRRHRKRGPPGGPKNGRGVAMRGVAISGVLAG